MSLSDLASKLDPLRGCREYGIPWWQCPQPLFLVMGLVIIGTMVGTYALGVRLIRDPQVVNLLIIFVTVVLLVFAYIITRSFEDLVEANRLKSEFVSIVSHQLRSPLSNLKWATEFLMSGRAGLVGKEQTGYFKILYENAGRMHDLVNDLLSVSRIEQGRLPFQPRAFSFPELVDEVVEGFRPYINASNITLEVEGGEVPPVFFDPGKARQVLSNLLDNAIRYAWESEEAGEQKHGKKRVTVHYERAGPFVRCQVRDNGIGIPREDQKYIFEKFFRSSNTRERQTEGSGLGLYIAKATARQGGGDLGFESVEGEGSTFWFTIPIHQSS